MYSFPLNDTETIIMKDHANMYSEGNAFNGALYLTTERVVFVGYLINFNQKFVDQIPLEHIDKIIKDKTFFIVPNIMIVTSIRDKSLKFIVNKRDSWINKIEQEILKIK